MNNGMGGCICGRCNPVASVIRADQGKVRFRHMRVVKDGKIFNMGGVTVAFKEIAPGAITYAIARCSINDNFDKAKGRVIAEGRLSSPKYAETIGMSLSEFYANMRSQAVFQFEDFI